MSAPELSTTPLASRIRKTTRAALKHGVIKPEFANALELVSQKIAVIETYGHASVAWKEAALGVAHLESEFAAAGRARVEFARWSQDRLGLCYLRVAIQAFPVEFEANRLGLIFEIYSEDGSFWVTHAADGMCQALVEPREAETLQQCLLRLSVELNAEMQLRMEAPTASMVRH